MRKVDYESDTVEVVIAGSTSRVLRARCVASVDTIGNKEKVLDSRIRV